MYNLKMLITHHFQYHSHSSRSHIRLFPDSLIRKTNLCPRFFFCIILTLFISHSFIFSENEIKTDYAFAEKLYSEENYRASLVELKRLFYYAAPDQDLRQPERLLIKCYASLGEKADLKKNLKGYVKKYKEEKADIYFDLSKTFYLLKKYDDSEEYNNLALEASKPDYPYFKNGTLAMLSGILKLKLLDFKEAKTSFDNFLKVASEQSSDNQESYNKEYIELALSLSQELNTVQYPQKSVPLSVILSALLPGSGQVYSGKFNKGLYSFLINASLIGATAYSLNQDEKLSGALFLVIDLPFYISNIRDSVSYTKQYNEKAKQSALKQIEKKYTLIEYIFK